MRTKMKSGLGIILSLALVLGMVPEMCMTVKAATAMPAADGDGVVTLTENVELTSTWMPSGNITLDLNGYGIKKTGSGGSVIKVDGGATLTIIDSNNSSTHKFDIIDGVAVLNEESGELTINGGYITGGSGTSEGGGLFWGSGGGIWVKNGTCTMNAGTVLGNAAAQGGGVLVYSGTFNLNGGSISYNNGDAGVELRSGSDVYNTGGGATTATLNMTGGEIKNNKSHAINGSNYCYGNSVANISGGVISNNGGVGITANEVSISGSAAIIDNHSTGVQFNALTLSGSPIISGNTVPVNESTVLSRNVYVRNGKTITIGGILSNTTPIGITTQTEPASEAPVVFTSSLDGNGTATKFVADISDSFRVKTQDGEAALVNLEDIALSHTVTFKVNNGSWNDGTTEDVVVTLTGYEGDALRLNADDIPTVGSKPSMSYKEGSWDVVPSADNVISTDVTYTYSYAAFEEEDKGRVNVPKTSGNFAAGGLDNSEAEIKNIVLEDTDQAQMEAGKDVNVWLEVQESTTTVTQEEKGLVEAKVAESLGSEYTVGSFLELILWKQITGEQP
ncbi:MAG: hypothetical protein K6G30_07260, partial [Acetatifactor sp.]|nr:hypothetical protein [Acetatifactor sp.]